MAHELESLTRGLASLRHSPPTAALVREEAAAIAERVAKTTGASVRVTDAEVRFAGRKAAVAAEEFRRLAQMAAPEWAARVAADVVGRLS